MKRFKLTCNQFFHFYILIISAISTAKSSIEEQFHIKISDFPHGFLFGAATSSYQVEGAVLEDGRSKSNWDVFCHTEGNIEDGSNADIADDHYHRYMDDIEIMNSLGLSAYRFSISWSRLLPRGRLGGVNQLGVVFYNNLIDNLLLRGIQPFVTIFHNEHPQELQDRFEGWLSPLMQEEYVYFAKTCFERFGDRVKYWITINEPNIYAVYAYEMVGFPPGRCSLPFGNCTDGNSDVEPLIAVHNMLLAHAKAAKLYREMFKSKADGVLGITVNAFMYVPMTDSKADKEAADRALSFNVAWVLDPLILGDYPSEMKKYHGSELPRFSSEERALLRESLDFIGINHYGTLYTMDCIRSSCPQGSDRAIQGFVHTTGERNGVPIGEPMGIPFFYVVPKGMEDIVRYAKERYNNKAMIITENGYCSLNNGNDDNLHDVKRIHYHQSYLAHLAQAIRDGADVRGYVIWSLMDNFEWANGFGPKFGLYYVDHQTLDRIPKLSATWYRGFLAKSSIEEQIDIKRSDFPHGFLFGAATSSYQVEGAVLEDGRSLSNWDVFCHIQGNIEDGSNADIADDHYHRYMEDIEIMNSLGLSAYRFSISWSRLLPRGRLGGVNQLGVVFYNNLIDNLLLRGIQPFVTIFHNEFPQELQDRFGGWLSPLMQEEYVYFAKTCFETFGDRVKYWITINEPNIYAKFAYEMPGFPPGRCSPPFGNCVDGNSDVEPLIAVHNMLLAHAEAAKLYRENIKSKADGLLGITLNTFMYVPMTDSKADKEAADRALAFNVAWVLDPLILGDYPTEMKKYHGIELPRFSSEERDLLRDSLDFIGINHYSTLYAKDCIHSSCPQGSDRAIQGFVHTTGERNGVLIGEPTGIDHFYVVPKGMEDIVSYAKERYNNKAMIITENGYCSLGNGNDDSLHDVKRVHYHRSYLAHLAQAIRDGADVRGYLIWTLMDNFEWSKGFGPKFGLYYVDHQTLDRIPKLSATWYGDFLRDSSSVDANLSAAISYENSDELEIQSE